MLFFVINCKYTPFFKNAKKILCFFMSLLALPNLLLAGSVCCLVREQRPPRHG